MPNPSEEMMSVYKSLQANNRERIYSTEARERWLESNEGKTVRDYNRFSINADFMPWRDELIRKLETGRGLSKTEEGPLGRVTWVDYQKLDLRSHDAFADIAARQAYNGLAERFADEVLMGQTVQPVYKFDIDSFSTFKTLLDEAKASAQRNATELGTELATAMTLAGEDVRRTAGDETVWPKSDLYESLEELKTALKDWNTLLAKDVLPDEKALRDAAKECNDKLYVCYRAHAELTTSGGKEAVPFVKYQLLATMRAIGEKVASQYIARAGKASLTAMYELIRDVPNRGPADQAAQKAYDLVSTYGDDLAKAWDGELTKVRKDLGRANKNILAELNAEFGKRAGLDESTIPEALTSWRSNFKNLDLLKKNQEVLRKSIAEIAFGLRQYKESVDAVFTKFESVESNSGKVKIINGIRDRFQQTFDGVAKQLHQDLLQAVNTLQ